MNFHISISITNSFLREDKNRLKEYDFFRKHIKSYEDLGVKLFPDDSDYHDFLNNIPTVGEKPLNKTSNMF